MIRILKEIIKVPIHYMTLLVEYIISPRSLIKSLENKFKGETIYCVGGGPSLNSEDLSLLNNKIVILCNFAYKVLDRCEPKYKISISQDTRRISSLKDVDRKLFDLSLRVLYDRPHLLFKFIKEGSFKREDKIIIPKMYGIFRDTKWKKEDLLERGLNGNIIMGNSVINSAIQLAYYLGAKRIVLLGVDMNYNNGATHFDQDRPYDRKESIVKPIEEGMISNLKDLTEALSKKNIALINTSSLTKEPYTQKMSLKDVVKSK
ncbi:MAG: DUF115 domain-containing protein [Chitinophagales bacterium]|nr:DUF115 domain-containing protein [Chitinophagales bacterium]